MPERVEREVRSDVRSVTSLPVGGSEWPLPSVTEGPWQSHLFGVRGGLTDSEYIVDQ